MCGGFIAFPLCFCTGFRPGTSGLYGDAHMKKAACAAWDGGAAWGQPASAWKARAVISSTVPVPLMAL
jgi:hypothetical protein